MPSNSGTQDTLLYTSFPDVLTTDAATKFTLKQDQLAASNYQTGPQSGGAQLQS